MENHLIGMIDAVLMSSRQISGLTYWLKLMLDPVLYPDADLLPGYLLPVFTGNGTGFQKFQIWDHDTGKGIVDIAVSAPQNTALYTWLKGLNPGQTIRVLPPKKMDMELSDSDIYYLVGNFEALAFFYQLNRNLPILTKVRALVYAPAGGLWYPDTDKSYPFHYFIIAPYEKTRLLGLFKANFKRDKGSFTVILAGDDEVNQLFAKYFTGKRHIPPGSLKIIDPGFAWDTA